MSCDHTMCGAPGCLHCFPDAAAGSVRYVTPAAYARRVAASTRRLLDVIDNEDIDLSVQEALDAMVDALAALVVTEDVGLDMVGRALTERAGVMPAAVGAAVDE